MKKTLAARQAEMKKRWTTPPLPPPSTVNARLTQWPETDAPAAKNEVTEHRSNIHSDHIVMLLEKLTKVVDAMLVVKMQDDRNQNPRAEPLANQLEQRRGTMSLSEFAEFMKVCYQTAYRWVKEEQLPAAKVRGSYWLDPVLAARWWRERFVAAKPPSVIRFKPLRRAREMTAPSSGAESPSKTT
jgi:hypothetical protein